MEPHRLEPLQSSPSTFTVDAVTVNRATRPSMEMSGLTHFSACDIRYGAGLTVIYSFGAWCQQATDIFNGGAVVYPTERYNAAGCL
jgi:hypothetical protein